MQYINNQEKLFIPTLNWEMLNMASRMMPLPFQLTLTENGETLVCEKIIRVIPGKRLVAFGHWGNKPIVLKLFYEPGKAKRHAETDRAGIEKLQEAKIPTATLLLNGSVEKQRVQVLVFERIVDGENLNDIWQLKIDHNELMPLMKAVTVELATHHVLGILQKDLHLKNFLVTHNKIYTLDGGSVVRSQGVLPKEQSLNHLALFFSQLGVGTEGLQETLFQTYTKARGWIVKSSDIHFLRKATQQWTEKRWQDYRKKIQRNCSAFACVKTSHALMMYDRDDQSAELAAFLKNPEEMLAGADKYVLKNGRSTTVFKVKMGRRYVVVKRYNLKNKWHALRRCLRPTRAACAWNFAQRLYLFGVNTAKPIAFIEQRFLGLRGKSYFVTDYIEGQHLGDYFADYDGSGTPVFKRLAERVIELFLNLATLRLTHGDLKMTNILIYDDQPLLIDLDGMQEYQNKVALAQALKKELRRFLKNWEDRPWVRQLFDEVLSNCGFKKLL